MPERLMKLTCETDGCIVKDTPINLVTDALQYMCGACGQYITNAVEVIEEEVTDGPAEETV